MLLSTQNLVPYAEERYGVPYLHIHRADYHNIFVEEAKRLGVQIQLDSPVTGIDFNRPAVPLKDKPDFRADGLNPSAGNLCWVVRTLPI